MRDDAVLGHALPLDRGLGPRDTHNAQLYTIFILANIHHPHLFCVFWANLRNI